MSKSEDTVQLRGDVYIDVRNAKGELKDSRAIRNTIVTVGKNFLANWLVQATQSVAFMPYVALGTGTTAAVVGDTDLETALGTRSLGTLSDSTNVWQNQVTFGPGAPAAGTNAITEAGLFSALTAGTMFARTVFAAINKAAGDSLTVTWQVTLS